MTPSRVLLWDGCVNVRDLGGLPTVDGRTTRRGEVVRADSIHGLTPEGWKALVDFRVRLAIDLRDRHEVDEDRSQELPIRIVHIPIEPRLTPPAHAWPSMLEAYLALLDRFPAEFARAVATIGRTGDPLVVHCAG